MGLELEEKTIRNLVLALGIIGFLLLIIGVAEGKARIIVGIALALIVASGMIGCYYIMLTEGKL